MYHVKVDVKAVKEARRRRMAAKEALKIKNQHKGESDGKRLKIANFRLCIVLLFLKATTCPFRNLLALVH